MLETILDLASAAGIAILSVPAFSLNFRKKTLARIQKLVRGRSKEGDASALDTIAAELEAEAASSAARWRPVDEVCLRVGYFLLLGAAVVRVFV